jgi:multiple sugar transport system ATP-binding protein
MARLQMRQVRKQFDATTVIHGLDLEVGHGEFCVFVGPSGCGKSTLLRMIAGLESITEGTVSIDGRCVNDVLPRHRDIAMVFQSYALYPHMSVAENMGFGLKIAKAPRAEIDAKVLAAARTLQIEHLLQRRPKELSGGQRQRVAIGRAIVRAPRMFLFDEPLSNLDAALRVEMRVELARIKAQLDTTVVYVTHDQVEAMTLADKIVVLRAGRIEQVGRPLELYAQPANQFVAGFIGSPKMNLLEVRVAASTAETVEVELPEAGRLGLPCAEAPAAGTPLVFGIRPEHLRVVHPQDGHLVGQVTVAERLGSETYLHAQVGRLHLIARADGDAGAAAGDRVGLRFDPAQAHLFVPEGRRLRQGDASSQAAPPAGVENP